MRLNNIKVIGVEGKPGAGRFVGRTFYTVTCSDSAGLNHRLDWGSKAPPSVGENLSGIEVGDTPMYGKLKVLNVEAKPSFLGSGMAGTTEPAARPAGFPVAQDSKDISIIRQNSVGHAVKLVTDNFSVFFPNAGGLTDGDTLIKKVIEVAFYISEFSSGSLEVDIKNRLADKLSGGGK